MCILCKATLIANNDIDPREKVGRLLEIISEMMAMKIECDTYLEQVFEQQAVKFTIRQALGIEMCAAYFNNTSFDANKRANELIASSEAGKIAELVINKARMH
jgi:hypothetical protein